MYQSTDSTTTRETGAMLRFEDVSKLYGPGCDHCLELTGAEHGRSICPRCRSVVAINRANLAVRRSEVLGIVGESGSGKSTLLQLIYRDTLASSGRILYERLKNRDGSPVDITRATRHQERWLRTRLLAMIYQNPRLGLNFDFSAGGNIAEKIIATGEKRFAEIRGGALSSMETIELPTSRIDHLPEGFSGGQQQRIQIAKALATKPDLLLLDEPTTGLDVSVQARILDLIRHLQHQMGFAMIIVSHDLGVIRHLTDLCVVVQHGTIVESGLTDQILEDPQHPYSQLLVSSEL